MNSPIKWLMLHSKKACSEATRCGISENAQGCT